MRSVLPAPQRSTRVVAALIGIPFLVALAALTLTPSRVEKSMPNVLDLVLSTAHRLGWESLNFNRLEVLANVAVFVPVGILAFVLVPRRVWPVALLFGPALSISIEVTQRLALPHRAPTVADVIANSIGASIGVVFAIFCTLLFAPRNLPTTTLDAA